MTKRQPDERQVNERHANVLPEEHTQASSIYEGLEPVALERLVLREIQLPLVEPFRISSGVTTTRRIFLLELFDRDGSSTWAECVAGDVPNYSPETIDTAWLAVREWLAPKLIGKTVHPANASALLDHDVRGHEMAKAGLEMGLWALAGTKAGISLSQAIGGVRESVETGISLGIQSSPQELVDKARAAIDEGYRKVKIKIKPGMDVAYVAEVRQQLGSSAPLMVDANNAYSLDSSGQDGTSALLALDDLDLVMIEQPLAWDDVVRHAQLQRQMKTRICLDESITNLAKAQDMIDLGSGRIINIKPGRVGGFATSLRIHDLCVAHAIPVWCGGMLESGIGRAYNVALASLGGFTIPGDVSPSARYWKQDVVTPEWTMNSDGQIAVPTSPGLGIEVDAERIESLAIRTEVLEA